jgi:hypothetical protein
MPSADDDDLLDLPPFHQLCDLQGHRRTMVPSLQSEMGTVLGLRADEAHPWRKRRRAVVRDVHPPRSDLLAQLPDLWTAGPVDPRAV